MSDLPEVVFSLDDVPDSARGRYIETAPGEYWLPMPEKNEGGEGSEKRFSEEQVQEFVTDRLKRERKRLKSELRDQVRTELLVDDAFRREALDEWDIDPAHDGEGGKLDDGKVQELHQTWKTEHLDPVQERAETLESEIDSLRVSQLESDLLAEAGGIVQKSVLKRQANGRTALFNMIGGEFTYDEEDGEWRVKGENGDYRPSPSGDRLYMTPPEFVKNVWATDDDNAPFIRDTTQGGSDYQGGSSGGGKRTYSRDEYNKLCADERYYAKHRDELLAAEREGRVKG
ncbi:MAG: hypothetical protein GWN53_17255 [Gammaproteobacteria bacterium]|uniref:Uncharacterized protein n=1 Tax=Candidatus Kutchimonas denitrificans TaxID=3056748 RepID=A0AAE4ZC57_9BACT|nr:hypothetical protein [Candidatus Kutchimonas denitrificans]NIV53590.1 hypothetical protein [Gammaproteobacteria bacterium]